MMEDAMFVLRRVNLCRYEWNNIAVIQEELINLFEPEETLLLAEWLCANGYLTAHPIETPLKVRVSRKGIWALIEGDWCD